MAAEMAARSVPHQREGAFTVHYKGHQLNALYRPDFISMIRKLLN
jgi:hypothetical protein